MNISRWERGVVKPAFKSVEAVANALGIPIDMLVRLPRHPAAVAISLDDDVTE